jgi:hypothetical protein
MTVAKLRDARERKRRENGKCEGRKSHAELNPELVVLVPQMRRRRPKGATVVTGDFCRTCDARLHERTGECVLSSINFFDARSALTPHGARPCTQCGSCQAMRDQGSQLNTKE